MCIPPTIQVAWGKTDSNGYNDVSRMCIPPTIQVAWGKTDSNHYNDVPHVHPTHNSGGMGQDRQQWLGATEIIRWPQPAGTIPTSQPAGTIPASLLF